MKSASKARSRNTTHPLTPSCPQWPRCATLPGPPALPALPQFTARLSATMMEHVLLVMCATSAEGRPSHLQSLIRQRTGRNSQSLSCAALRS